LIFNADLTGTGSIPICIWMCDRQDSCMEKYTLCARQNSLDWIGNDVHWAFNPQGHSISPIFVPIENQYTTSYYWI